MPKIKDKERILKTAREKHSVTYKGAPIRLSADFSKETEGQEGLARNIQSEYEKHEPTTKITPPRKAIIQSRRPDKKLTRKKRKKEKKAKEVHHHQASII